MNRYMTKLKRVKPGLTIQWTQVPGEGRSSEVHSVTCCDAPARELKDALAAMVAPLIDLCDLPRDWAVDLQVIGVTLSEEFQLEPEQSTTALICHHRQAKYFNVR